MSQTRASRKRGASALASVAKRPKKATKVLHSIVLLQQSSVFNDKQQALSAGTDEERLREQRDLLNTLDARTLRRYSDSLCVDMTSTSTLDKMHAVSGEQDQRCICGTPRLADDTQRDVLLGTHGRVVQAHMCNACGRFAVAYQRFCVDGPKVKQAIRSANRAQQRTDASALLVSNDELSASSDSLDAFVDHLLAIFDQQSVQQGSPKTPARVRSRLRRTGRKKTNARKNLFNDTTATENAPPGMSKFTYGNRYVHCSHASLNSLNTPHKDGVLIGRMFGD